MEICLSKYAPSNFYSRLFHALTNNIDLQSAPMVPLKPHTTQRFKIITVCSISAKNYYKQFYTRSTNNYTNPL